MKEQLSEEEMRQALFGSSASQPKPLKVPEPSVASDPQPVSTPRPPLKSLSPKLRVTLRVMKQFEGDAEIFTYDANILSTFAAEQLAKAEAKKNKFRYFELISIKPIE
ncbi:hypothetical protein D3C75_681190 [compost metagenome]